MKTLLTLCSGALLLLGASIAVAEHGGLAGDRHDSHLYEGSMHGDRLANALNLTANQKTAAHKLREDMAVQAQPLWMQARGQREEIEALLDSKDADPTAIGQKMIAAHQLRLQLKALHQDFEAKFIALLDAGQQAKFKELRAQHQERRHDPSHFDND